MAECVVLWSGSGAVHVRSCGPYFSDVVCCVRDEDSTGSHAELEDFCGVGFHPLGPEGDIRYSSKMFHFLLLCCWRTS